MVLRREDTLSCSEILDWLVLPSVSIWELIRPSPTRECEQLIPETYPEYFFIFFDSFSYFGNRGFVLGRISRTIREKNPIEFSLQFHEWIFTRDSYDIDTKCEKVSEHIIFHSHVDDEKGFSDRIFRVISYYFLC